MRDFIRRERQEKDAELKNIYAAQRMKIQEQLGDYLKKMQADTLDRLSKLKDEEKRLENLIAGIKLQKKYIIESYAVELAQSLINYTSPTGDKIFEGIQGAVA